MHRVRGRNHVFDPGVPVVRQSVVGRRFAKLVAEAYRCQTFPRFGLQTVSSDQALHGASRNSYMLCHVSETAHPLRRVEIGVCRWLELGTDKELASTDTHHRTMHFHRRHRSTIAPLTRGYRGRSRFVVLQALLLQRRRP